MGPSVTCPCSPRRRHRVAGSGLGPSSQPVRAGGHGMGGCTAYGRRPAAVQRGMQLCTPQSGGLGDDPSCAVPEPWMQLCRSRHSPCTPLHTERLRQPQPQFAAGHLRPLPHVGRAERGARKPKFLHRDSAWLEDGSHHPGRRATLWRGPNSAVARSNVGYHLRRLCKLQRALASQRYERWGDCRCRIGRVQTRLLFWYVPPDQHKTVAFGR